MKNPKNTKALRRELRQKATNAEKIMWTHFRNRKCDGLKIKRQFGIGPYVVDFYVPELEIAIEVDGSIQDLPENRIHDLNRDTYLDEQGVQVIRVRNIEVEEQLESMLLRLTKIFRNKKNSLS